MAKAQPINEARKTYSQQIPAIKNALADTWMVFLFSCRFIFRGRNYSQYLKQFMNKRKP